MASGKLSCIGDPNFASVVYFLMRFSSECNIDELNIEELASHLENSDEVAPAIEDIHTKLLRKIRKTVPSGKWENVLAKFAYTYSMQDAWELERFGYKKSSLSVKLRVLKALVESQFDRNVKFKTYINGIAAQDLRVEPVGRDMLGNIYWCIMDRFSNIRIFRENLDDESWTVVASNRDEMVKLIDKLSSNDAEIFSIQSPIEEDSCSTVTSIHSEEKLDNKKIQISLSDDKEMFDMEDKIDPEPDTNVEKNKTSVKLESYSTESYNETETMECAPIVKSGSANSKNESDTTKDASIVVENKPSGTKSVAKPVFSSVITEPVFIIQGQGNGEENDMGNVKNGDKSNTTPSAEKTLSKINLPLKKKINKSYCESVSGFAKSINQTDDVSNDEIKQFLKSNEDKSGILETDSTGKSENILNESPKKDIIVQIENTTTNELKTEMTTSESVLKNTASGSKSPELIEQEKSTEQKPDVPKIQENNREQKKPSCLDDSQPAKRSKRGRKTRSGIVDGLDISQVIIDNSNDGPPVRQSRRIAQQKIKEETDRRMIEEKMLREMKKEAIKNKKKTASHSDDEEYVVSDSENSKNTVESRTKKKKSDKPWLSSTSESSSDTEPEEDYIEHDNYDNRRSPYKSDHEFSPESDLETECAVPTKRARTVKAEGQESENESVDSNVDHACQKCGKTDHPEWILLCDSCDKGYHCSCLTPVLFIIPEGDWFCPKCQHAKLIVNLQKTLLQYDEVCSQFELLKKLKMQEANVKRLEKECVEEGNQDEMKKGNASSNEGAASSSSSETDEDDIPIYKLRRRNQNSNYRFNDYDDLINSAINRCITDDNEPITSGKDIRNIIKSNCKQETTRSKSKSRSRSKSPFVEKSKTRKNLKKKKLNNLDDTSDEDDESDTDFKDAETSTETENSLTEESESSLEFSLSRKLRKARKKLDTDFINDGDESDKSTYNMRKQRKKIQKILEDSDDFDEDEITESEEIDSADLCSDTETDSSSDKNRGKIKQTNNTRIAAEKNATNNRKRKVKKTDEDKAYRSGIKKKTKVTGSASSSSDDDKTLNTLGKRRTRGKKLHYILDEDFESSDDGITPGVQRPDTPPEERERFIKKQEEIKRMLAEKNTAAAKELATPKIKSLNESCEPFKQAPLSVVPMQVIEGAKALDMDFLKSSKAIDDDDFDDELAVNFSDPGDVNEDELAKIMEEEDFAQHHLKLDYEASARKTTTEISPKKKIRDFDTINPSDITKIDKKGVATVSIEKCYKHDGPHSRPPSIRIEHEHSKPFIPNYLPDKLNELHPYYLPNYSCVLPSPPSAVSTSILQQMKEQAIPLQSCQQPTKFLPTPTPTLSESQYLPAPVLLVPSVTLISKGADAVPSNLPKVASDIRRRRRKKITPLRGDLYKVVDDSSLVKSASNLHYHLPPNAPAAETVTLDYTKSKQTVVVSDLSPSTHEKECLKSTEVDLQYPGAYTPSSMFPHRAPATNIHTSSLTSSSGILAPPSNQSFITLEPVNAVDQPVESPAASENIGNVTVDAECSSEFSGLVSYFSSQQNELNA